MLLVAEPDVVDEFCWDNGAEDEAETAAAVVVGVPGDLSEVSDIASLLSSMLHVDAFGGSALPSSGSLVMSGLTAADSLS